ncbi:hypothetical protein QTP70_007104 [Hemibagrus guttatus]|uniref:ribonuclease H n=1 Tax=Hemibagrus guttatus TaxID=175788 RepID=A0AAE0RIK3_9TELE|nr:hypothetical protein QTP70_007104 [Hemibagrus guttatus]
MHTPRESTADVRKTLCSVNPEKAAGPDNIPDRVLRECAEQLAEVFTDIFNISLSSAIVPTCLKTITIIPMLKKSPVSRLNDYRPVALTPIIMKCFERLIMKHIKNLLPPSLDPMQFAYCPNRSTDDAISTTLHLILTHLDNRDTYVQMIFINFSSAFNTIIPQNLIKEHNHTPQGCMFSPLLFTLLTHDFAAMHSFNHIIKFANDTTVRKRKRWLLRAPNSSGVHLAEDLTWSLNTSSITKKAQQHFYFLRRLKKAHLPPPILTTFYRGTIESILSSCITAWFRNCTVSDRKTLQRIVRTAEKIIGVSLPSKLERSRVNDHLATWIIDYLTNRPQYERLRDCVFEVVACNTGALQGTVRSLFLFTPYTSDFSYNTCHLQKFSDDSAITGCVSEGNKQEYRDVIKDFVDSCEYNHLHLNTSKTKKLFIDILIRRTPYHTPVIIQDLDIELVDSFKYLGVHLNNRLDWLDNTDTLYKKGQSCLLLLKRLGSFGVSRTLLRTFYDTVVSSAILCAIVCWVGGSTERDRKRLNKLVGRASSVLGCPLNLVEEVGKGRELADVMERRKVDILCVQETRWKGSKARSIGAGFKLFYYGVDNKRNGVGVVLKEEFVRNVLEVGCELEEKERFWSELDEVMESIPTGERVVIGADFNGHVGEGNTGDEEVMGKFGVKERNLEGQMVVDFAKRMDMGVVNTYFQKREEHRVTYKSGGRRTQIEKKTKWWKLKKEECSEVIRETGRKVLGVSSGRRKEDKETWWWNEEVQDSIQRKRLAKKKWDMDRTEENRQEYKELQRRVKREVSKAKQKAYEELYTRLDTREGEKDLYRLARQRDRDGKDVQQVRVIKDRDGRVLTSEESVQRRWKEYFEELMNEENEREKRVEGVNSVEQKVDKIRKDEVRKALKRMKSGKAVGPDDIPVEVWKCLGEAAVEFLANLFNRVLENLEKAYDRVPREELWYCMRKSGVAEKYVRVVQDMYERSRTVVRCAVVMDQLSEEVRQESPWTMMFADDIVICSESREQVEENLERWRFALERRGMKVSRSKTEYMCVNEREGSGTVRLQGEEVKKVQEFKYLGSTVQSNGECGKEVKKRVQAGWNGWRKVSGVLCDQKISARIKGKVYRTVVRPAMLYGLETVSLRKRQESELEVAELKMLRFSLGVTRLDRIRNEYIRGTAHVGRLGDKVREARLRWFGHVQRRDNYFACDVKNV